MQVWDVFKKGVFRTYQQESKPTDRSRLHIFVTFRAKTDLVVSSEKHGHLASPRCQGRDNGVGKKLLLPSMHQLTMYMIRWIHQP
ncbi:hypothetical protein SCLCIDRAFT_979766 [Scleroderma citrinum Foug A]|uniref:Uncharacterized protein n=1 Tax=Scleroderma citrinum Foug A TaxID=1036808 RepID=A0A0C3DUT5_9AGAM|nr:hypothetical protein SCLCIDRAFT_979766 [Scleroderma citrinum Foug A]